MTTTMEHRHHSASILTAVLPLNVQLVKIAEPSSPTYTAPPCQKTNSNKCSERSTMSGHNSKHFSPKQWPTQQQQHHRGVPLASTARLNNRYIRSLTYCMNIDRQTPRQQQQQQQQPPPETFKKVINVR